jgi:hypothetical protein
MIDNKLFNIGVKLLEIASKGDYDKIVCEAALYISHSIFSGTFEQGDWITYQCFKGDKNVDILKRLFKKSGFKVKVDLVKNSKEYSDNGYDIKIDGIYEYRLNYKLKYKPINDRFEILDL